jgi:thioesterase domain-containing protein
MEELAQMVDIPCFALETSKMNMDKCDNLEAVAAELLLAVREVAPEGPVLLGGLGFGCRVAFEMALQMEAEKESNEVRYNMTKRLDKIT